MRSGPESPFWKIKGMSVVDHVADYADVPVLHVTGWYDSWTRQVTMNYEALSKAKKSPQRLTIGPWVHGGAGLERRGRGRVHAPTPRSTCSAYRLRWYDRWLEGRAQRRRRRPAGAALHHGDRRRPPVAGRPAPARRLLAGRARVAARPGPADAATTSTPTARLDADARRRGRERHDLHLRPAPSGADDRRQHLVEPGPDDQRRLRPAAARRHPRRRATACRSPSAATCSSSGPRRWTRTSRSPARSRSSSGSARPPPTPTSPPS